MNQEIFRESSLHPEVSVLFRTAGNNSEVQIRQIEEMIEEGIDVLLVSPNESAPLTPIIERVYKNGIPVVLIDRSITSNLFTAFIGADNYQIGHVAGKYLASKFPEGGNILTIEIPQSISPGLKRAKGFREGIKLNPKLRISQVVTDSILHNDPDNLKPYLNNDVRVDIIFSHTDFMAELANTYAKESGLADSIFFMGVDGLPGSGRGIEAVEDGILDATVLYPTRGDDAVRLILAVLNELPYQKENSLETIIIEPSNADILLNQMRRVKQLQLLIDEETEQLDILSSTNQGQRILIGILLVTLIGALALGISLFYSLRSKKIALQSLRQKNRETEENQRQLQQLSEQLAEADEVAFNEDKPFDVAYFISRIQEMLQRQHHDEEETMHRSMIRESRLDKVLRQDELNAEDRAFLERIAAYVDERYGESNFKATDLCQELGMSRSQLYRKVKNLLGEGVTSYVETVRLLKAERLLVETNEPIADIAYKVGYSTPEYFAKVFKARSRHSPSSFRKKFTET